MASEASPRRLLVVRPTLGEGGADRVTVTLLRGLPRERFRITLALMRAEGPFLDRVPDDVELIDLGARRLWNAVVPLADLVRERRPEILFSTSGGMNLVACLAAPSAPGCRLVLSERGLLFRGHGTAKRSLLFLFKRLLYPRADCVTAVSRGVAAELVGRLGLPPGRVRVTYNPAVTADLAELSLHQPPHPWVGGGRPLVLAAGRLVPEKAFDLLVAAFARVRAHRAVRLLILGEGPERPRLLELARRLGVDNDVDLPGFDPNPFAYMRRCDLFILSSRREGLPGVMIQAMACGAPVVATDCPGGPGEIVADGETGRLVAPEDEAALAQAMLGLLTDNRTRLRLAEAGRRSVQRFAVSPVLDRYVAALEGRSP